MKTPETVYFHLDPDNPPVLTAEEQQAWTELLKMGDEGIDYIDIPPMPATGWRRVSELVLILKSDSII